MEEVWGPADDRAALAFVHIPPYVKITVSCPLFRISFRNVVQNLSETLNSTKDPGLNGP